MEEDQIKKICEFYKIKIKINDLSLLHSIYSQCKKEKINVTNIEFRYILNLFMKNELTLFELIKELKVIKEEIQKYNDKELNSFYKFLIHKVNLQCDQLTQFNLYYLKDCFQDPIFIKIIENSFAMKAFFSDIHNFNQMSKKKQINCIELFFIFDLYYWVLEVRLIHYIYNNQNKNIFIIAGGDHIDKLIWVNKMLVDLKSDIYYTIDKEILINNCNEIIDFNNLKS